MVKDIRKSSETVTGQNVCKTFDVFPDVYYGVYSVYVPKLNLFRFLGVLR